jgi:hypothetical protein
LDSDSLLRHPSKESGQRARAAHYFGLLAVFALLATTVIGYWTIR